MRDRTTAEGAKRRGGRTRLSEQAWAQVRQDYLAGDTAEAVSARYGVGASTVRHHATRGKWRRCDQPDPPPVDPDLDLDIEDAGDPPDYATLARHALARLNRAVLSGRAAEAGSWMRLHQRLSDLARRAAEAAAPPPPPDPAEEEDRRFAALTAHLDAVGDLARDLARDDLDDPLVRETMMLRLNQTKRAHKHLFPHRADEPLLAEFRDDRDSSDGVFSAAGSETPPPDP